MFEGQAGESFEQVRGCADALMGGGLDVFGVGFGVDKKWVGGGLCAGWPTGNSTGTSEDVPHTAAIALQYETIDVRRADNGTYVCCFLGDQTRSLIWQRRNEP